MIVILIEIDSRKVPQADGKQFVVVAATGGGKLRLPPGDAYVAFALP